VGAATAKLREPKHVRTRGTANKLLWVRVRVANKRVLYCRVTTG